MNYFKKPTVLVIIAAILVIVGVGASYLFYSKTQKPQDPTQNQQKDAAKEAADVKKLVAEVGKLIELPTGEDPTVATVTDITKLQDQPFFAKAKNGDKVLIYTNARRAILYDPNAKKVIDVAPINIGSSSAEVATPKIVLRNGTTTVGLTTKVEDQLKKAVANLNVVEKENASKTDYSNTLIVVLNSSAKDFATNLTSLLKGSVVGDLPSGESKPKAGDVLIILGKDRT